MDLRVHALAVQQTNNYTAFIVFPLSCCKQGRLVRRARPVARRVALVTSAVPPVARKSPVWLATPLPPAPSRVRPVRVAPTATAAAPSHVTRVRRGTAATTSGTACCSVRPDITPCRDQTAAVCVRMVPIASLVVRRATRVKPGTRVTLTELMKRCARQVPTPWKDRIHAYLVRQVPTVL